MTYGADGHKQANDESTQNGGEVVADALVDCEFQNGSFIHTHGSEDAEFPLWIPDVGLNGEHQLEQPHDVAYKGDDGVQNLQDDHPGFDVGWEAEAVEDVYVFVIYIIKQIVFEIIPSLSRDIWANFDI